MKKSTLALAVAVAAIAQQVNAAGFIDDSKVTLGLRNFYINTDNRYRTRYDSSSSPNCEPSSFINTDFLPFAKVVLEGSITSK